MKKALLIAPLAILALASCNKMDDPKVNPQIQNEMSFVPMTPTKGYVEGTAFLETYASTLHGTKTPKWRTMQISSYLTPQNGEEGNYFVDKTYAHSGNTVTWWNVNPSTYAHDPIYWPVGGTLDFLAFSLSEEPGTVKNIDVTWNKENASSQVVLDVPGENSQNDILFASAYGIKAPSSQKDVAMTFNHAQAWLEFQLTGSVDAQYPDGIVKLSRIELEDVYNAGVLTVNNNKGNATATWDFSAESKKNIAVDNEYSVKQLNEDVQYLDMLIPQQKKTAFVIYYTLGNDTQELSYRFTSDLKTWLMGEKYIYKINITTSEVTVAPIVTEWKPVTERDVTIY